jgi:G3E family GTPase
VLHPAQGLLEQIVQLAKKQKFDYLLIESTGVSEPMQVAETFSFEGAEGAVARLDTCVTMIDAAHFYLDLASKDALVDRKQATDENDKRDIATLLIDQVEFADGIIINKIDLVTKEQLGVVRATCETLNPRAKIILSVQSQVPLKQILNNGLFSPEEASRKPGWLQHTELVPGPGTTLKSELDDSGISSFVFRARRPFHPQRYFQRCLFVYMSEMLA